MAYLILVRHGVTDWNVEGRWHGLTDIPLNEEGRKQSRQAAETVKDIKIDTAYTSNLVRTKQTYQEICDSLNISCHVLHTPALNERDYGIYTGKNKWQVRKELGEDEFLKLRRSFDYPIPGGETLKDVYDRVVPFYKQQILRDLRSDKNVLVVSSGNILRALIKYLENLSDQEITNFELGFDKVLVFNINKKGRIVGKEIRVRNLYKGKH